MSPCTTATGEPLGRVLDWWAIQRAPRSGSRERLYQEDGVDPDDVIMSPAAGAENGA